MRGRPEDETYQSIFNEDKCMYWQLLNFLVCIGMYRNSCCGMYLYVVCICMYWNGMFCGIYCYVLFLVCLASIGMYWYVLTFDLCKY